MWLILLSTKLMYTIANFAGVPQAYKIARSCSHFIMILLTNADLKNTDCKRKKKYLTKTDYSIHLPK